MVKNASVYKPRVGFVVIHEIWKNGTFFIQKFVKNILIFLACLSYFLKVNRNSLRLPIDIADNSSYFCANCKTATWYQAGHKYLSLPPKGWKFVD